ncbi:MAG TPA: purine-nucleoside phosphorylase [Acidimicrobiales bacterium]|jgi:purine-nucleoside phosphorylase|nr:purine-nucleoside phosphorylase [Acidimicrobiales bacterium]
MPGPQPVDLGGAALDPLALAEEAAAVLAGETGVSRHRVAIVLGTGLDGAVDALGQPVGTCSYARLPGLAPPTVRGHHGEVASMLVGPRPVLVFRGRVHLYEGRSAPETVHAVRIAVAAGCRCVILTNSSGSLDPTLGSGSIVAVADHINCTGQSPLVGFPADGEGPTPFVDQTAIWSPRLRALVRSLDPTISEGVYAQVLGPQFETPAEISMLRSMGADLVGMSTALEALAAVHLGAEVLGLSLVSNLAAGLTPRVTVEDIRQAGATGAPDVGRLLRALLDHPDLELGQP